MGERNKIYWRREWKEIRNEINVENEGKKRKKIQVGRKREKYKWVE